MPFWDLIVRANVFFLFVYLFGFMLIYMLGFNSIILMVVQKMDVSFSWLNCLFVLYLDFGLSYSIFLFSHLF